PPETRRFTKWLPMKPQPPVTRTLTLSFSLFQQFPSRLGEPAGAGDHVLEHDGLVHPPDDSVSSAPAAHPLAVELERRGKSVEPPANGPTRMRSGGELSTPIPQEGGRIELPLRDDRLGVDRKPALALRAQHIAAVEVLMGHDEGSLVRPRLAEKGDGGVQQRAFERATVTLPTLGQLVGPAL